MDILDEINREVEEEANLKLDEVLIRLLDRLESEGPRLCVKHGIFLYQYIRAKINLTKAKRHCRFSITEMSYRHLNQAAERAKSLGEKFHGATCSCILQAPEGSTCIGEMNGQRTEQPREPQRGFSNPTTGEVFSFDRLE